MAPAGGRGFVLSGLVQRAPARGQTEAGPMTTATPVIVYPPDETGGRRVGVGDVILGTAFSVRDVAAFMQEAGLQDWNEMDVVRSSLIQWWGGGPEVWTL